MKPRILIIANDESTIYNFRREIISAFSTHGYDVTLCFPEGDHTSEIERCGCRIVNISVSRHGTNPFAEIGFLLTCIKLIRRNNPSVVLTYTIKPNIYGSLACQITKVPYINNVTGLGSVFQSNSLLARILVKMQRKAYRKSSCVFFQNEANFKLMLEKGVVSNNTPYEILPGSGVNLTLHSFEPMRSYDGTIRFIIVSRIRKDKGFDEFFKAAEAIKKEYPECEFRIVGWYEEDQYKAQLDRLEGEGIVKYYGKKTQEEVHQLIVDSDCVVLPSYHEGMANVLLEAASSGRPVIASNIPGCKETFDEGITGFGCEVKNAESLKCAMLRMINSPYEKRAEMGRLGRVKMEKEFDRSFVADKYIKCIESISGQEND